MNKEEAKIIFGENLKRLRLARNMSQDELAKALGYTPVCVCSPIDKMSLFSGFSEVKHLICPRAMDKKSPKKSPNNKSPRLKVEGPLKR